MGNCTSSQQEEMGRSINKPLTAKIIHWDGRLQEFRHPVKASHVLPSNPNCFLCSSESMYLDSHVPHMTEDEELQLGQIYFLIPLSQSHEPLSLQNLGELATKASSALSHPKMVSCSGSTQASPISVSNDF